MQSRSTSAPIPRQGPDRRTATTRPEAPAARGSARGPACSDHAKPGPHHAEPGPHHAEPGPHHAEPGPRYTKPGPHRREPGWPPMSRRQATLLVATAAVYLLVLAGVLLNTALVDLDWSVRLLRPYERWPRPEPLLDTWVVAGQRGPSAIAAFGWLAWRAHRLRRLRPLLVMGVALLLLNVTVGAVKIVTGRLGPHYAQYVGSPELFSGGTIFPSGHTANAVVTWGVLAYLAVRWRRTGAVIAAATACSIGLTTVYLGTHWVTDVLAGWAAGLLVLLSLPLLEPLVATAEHRIHRRLGRPPLPY